MKINPFSLKRSREASKHRMVVFAAEKSLELDTKARLECRLAEAEDKIIETIRRWNDEQSAKAGKHSVVCVIQH